MGKNYKPQSLARRRFNGLPDPSGPGETHVDSFSVARVRPRTSKGITDLLLLNLAWLNATCPSKKSAPALWERADYLAGQSLVRYRN